MEKIRIAVVGYGNIGRGGVIADSGQNPDMQPVAVFSRRAVEVRSQVSVPVFENDTTAAPTRDEVDVAILCGGSKNDLPIQGPHFARRYPTVDSFDTHADILKHLDAMDRAAREGGNIAIISAGWDPGIFSLQRALAGAILPQGMTETFWGRGVSQGHSEAARQVDGVKNARSYTLPIEETMARVRSGDATTLAAGEKHTRLVYVVSEPGADEEQIASAIRGMPNYFADYRTEVRFISEAEMERDHAAFPHGGFVLKHGVTGGGYDSLTEYRCQLASNPEFTASVLIACARAAVRMTSGGWEKGAYTMLDIPPSYYHPLQRGELIEQLM